MNYGSSEEDAYKDTVDSSKELSVRKAVEIFMAEQEKNKTSIKRPDINPKNGIIKISVVVVLLCFLGILLVFFDISPTVVFLLALFIVAVKAKKTIIWLIQLYQKYAPERIRRACVYEPTCSDYMLIAIDKYGLIKGVTKGIKRLIRCHPPNGGIDNP